MTLQKWRDDAACRDLDPVQAVHIFFPHDRRAKDRWDDAWAFCRNCKVHQECLDMILQTDAIDDKTGMFGGLTPEERRQVRRGRIYFDKQFDDGFRWESNIRP